MCALWSTGPCDNLLQGQKVCSLCWRPHRAAVPSFYLMLHQLQMPAPHHRPPLPPLAARAQGDHSRDHKAALAEAEASVRTEHPRSYAEMARRRSSQQRASRQMQQPPATQVRQQQSHKQAGHLPAQPSAQPWVEQLPPASAATGQDQMVPILLALVHSLVGHLPTDDP